MSHSASYDILVFRFVNQIDKICHCGPLDSKHRLVEIINKCVNLMIYVGMSNQSIG